MKILSHLLFADDTILLANSIAGLKAQLNMLVEVFKECGMEINASKCVIICKPPEQCKIVINGGGK